MWRLRAVAQVGSLKRDGGGSPPPPPPPPFLPAWNQLSLSLLGNPMTNCKACRGDGAVDRCPICNSSEHYWWPLAELWLVEALRTQRIWDWSENGMISPPQPPKTFQGVTSRNPQAYGRDHKQFTMGAPTPSYSGVVHQQNSQITWVVTLKFILQNITETNFFYVHTLITVADFQGKLMFENVYIFVCCACDLF